MPPIFKDLLLSKKFVVALLTIAGSITAYKGWNVDPMTILTLTTPIFVYIGAQGWADSGKEAAKIQAATAIQLHTPFTSAVLNAADPIDGKVMSTTITKSSEAGFAKITVMLSTTIFSTFLCVAFFTPVSTVGGCAHPGQATLRVGQCLLDDGVLAEVLAALAKPDYLKQVENVGLARAGDLIDCALQAVAAQPPGTGSGSETLPARTLAQSDTLARRAREALAARHAGVS